MPGIKSNTVPGPLPPLPTIPPEERTPLVNVLLALLEHYRATDTQLRAIIEHQHALIAALEQRVRSLEAEVRRLKNLPSRPNIKPSALDKNRNDDDRPAPRRWPRPRKQTQTPRVEETPQAPQGPPLGHRRAREYPAPLTLSRLPRLHRPGPAHLPVQYPIPPGTIPTPPPASISSASCPSSSATPTSAPR